MNKPFFTFRHNDCKLTIHYALVLQDLTKTIVSKMILRILHSILIKNTRNSKQCMLKTKSEKFIILPMHKLKFSHSNTTTKITAATKLLW